MSNYLDDLFAAKTLVIRYAWTHTDVNASSGMGQVQFSSGILHYEPAPIYRGRPRWRAAVRRYKSATLGTRGYRCISLHESGFCRSWRGSC
jgi:hypothetical protein